MNKINFTDLYCYLLKTAVFVRFAYMMMRRYADAIRTFSNILLYVQRTKQMFQVQGGYGVVMTKSIPVAIR